MPAGHWSPALLEARASFVTLEQSGQLRGCMGSLEPRRALVEDVVHNAVAAASQDPRFPPLAVAELEITEIEISILGPLSPVLFRDEEDLLSQLQPAVDGLVLREGTRRGTFLPLVWEKLPERHTFLRQLKLKAGLPPDYWSATLQVWRYHTLVFREVGT